MRRVFGRHAIFADVGTEERDVSALPGPAPIVDFAAEIADARRWRVDNPNISDLEPTSRRDSRTALEPPLAARLQRLARLPWLRAEGVQVAMRKRRRSRLRTTRARARAISSKQQSTSTWAREPSRCAWNRP